MPICHARRIRPRRAARAAATAVASAAALAAAASPAVALNVVAEDQAVVGRQCVGMLCSETDAPPFVFQVRTGDTPGMRLEQTGDSGYTAQTWDVAGNEANFFVRDLTAGSQLPFRIFPGTLTNALTAGPEGVGVGTHRPASALEVNRAGARLTVTDSDVAAGARVLADLVNRGAPLLRFDDASGGQDWLLGASADGAFAVRDAADGSPDAFLVTPAGTATARGILQQSADPALRADVQPVDGAALLARLRGLEMTSWTTAADATGARHLGPSGAGFHAAFGLGGDSALAPSDLAAVALVAAQQLAGETDALAGRVGGLETRLGAAEATLARSPGGIDLGPLERAVATLTDRTDALTGRTDALTGRTDTLTGRLDAAERPRDDSAAGQLRDENAALRRRVEQLEAGRRTQAGRVRTLERRQRTADRRIRRLTTLVDRLLADR